MAGELRALWAERRIARRCQSLPRFIFVASVLGLRAVVERIAIRRAALLVCISAVFRDHLVRDYGFPLNATVLIPNPVRLERFAEVKRVRSEPPTVLVLGRVVTRKGVDDVVSVSHILDALGSGVRVRIVGEPSLASDYIPLLADLPKGTAEYCGSVPGVKVSCELARSNVLLQASRYEPFGLTVAEALAAGVPVVATTAVGAIEGVSAQVAIVVEPGNVNAMADGIMDLLDRAGRHPNTIESTARSEAARLFAADLVCEQISEALGDLIHRKRTLD
jgi:glycosyltransferase involved in cell wall biosynthesis